MVGLTGGRARMRFALFLALVFQARACPDPELCANTDCGSCGNACCKLQIFVAESSEITANLLKTAIQAGGPDGHYTSQMTYEGTDCIADLRPYNKPVDFIGQTIHTTLAPNYFNDTVSDYLCLQCSKLTYNSNREGELYRGFNTRWREHHQNV